MRQSIVAGNWKMNGNSQFANDMSLSINEYAKHLNGVEIVLSPSFVYLSQVESLAESFSTSAQNVAFAESGAFTGEVSVSMLSDIGVKYALVGHSERREIYSETDDVVAQKVEKVVASGVVPIICVGESLKQRQEGTAFDVVAAQVVSSLSKLHLDDIDAERIVVAYEPIWAIGTGETASPIQAQEMHAHIRKVLEQNVSIEFAARVRILYGGSVNAKSAEALFSQSDIDGGLVGGASLKIDEFKVICSAAAK